MRNEIKLLVLLGCIGLQGGAFGASTAEELSKIEAETAVLKARARKVEVQAQITAKQAEIVTKQADMKRVTQAPSVGDPVVQAVEGVGDSVYATLQFPNGRQVEVKAGDTLTNGSTVVSVRANEVIVQSSSKRRVRLANGAHAMPAPSPFASGGMPVPPLSQVPPLHAPTGAAQ